MPEPIEITLCARVRTATLERAIRQLPLAKYPRRLLVIDRELARRKSEQAEMRRERAGARRAA